MISVANACGRVYYRAKRIVAPGLRDNVVFLHLPKCGGSSVDSAIYGCYRGTGAPVARLNSEASSRGAELVSRKLLAYRRDLLVYLMASQRGGYITGHFPFSEAAHEAYGERWKFVTILRDPVERWFSSYFFNRHKNSECFRIDEELSDYVESERAALNGCMYLRYFSQLDGVPGQAQGREAIARSIANLEAMAVVGCLEQLDWFAKTFERSFGVRLSIGHQNKSPVARQSQRAQVTPALRRRVEELCRPDLEVYNYVLRMVARQGS